MTVQQNLLDDLTTSSLSDWTEVAGGAARSGIQIDSNNNTLYYSRSDLDIDNQRAFSIEAVVSGSPLTVDGELGARMWAKFRDAGMPPATCRHVELRLVRQTGAYRMDLVDGTSGAVMASLNKDWTSVAPRFRVRLKRQDVGGTDYIFLQSESSGGWDDPAQPNNLDDGNSKAVALASFGIAPATREFGFGNVQSGIYYSAWESIHLTVGSNLITVMPYWPPKANVPTTLDWVDTGLDNPAGQSIDFEADLTTGVANTTTGGTSNDPYVSNDVAEFFIHAATTSAAAADIAHATTATNPSAAPGTHSRGFTGLSDDQNSNANAVAGEVTGWATVTDVYGRSTKGDTGSVAIADETTPSALIRIVRADLPADDLQPLLGTYNNANQPVQICIDVTERHLDEANCNLVIQDVAGTPAYLNSTNLEDLVTTNGGFKEIVSAGTVWRYRWPVSAMSNPLREWDYLNPAGSKMRVSVTLQDDSGNTNASTIEHLFDLNTAAPAGTIVVAPDPGGGTPPAYSDFNPIPAAPSNIYGVANGVFVGIRLLGGNDDDLDWGDGSAPGSVFPSEMNLDSLSPADRDLDINAGFAEVSSGEDKIIYWAGSLSDGTYNVSFVLEDVAGNATSIASEQFVVDTVAPNAVVEINVDGGGWTSSPAASYPSGSTIEVRVTTTEANPNTTADAAPHSYIEVDDGTTTDNQEFGPGGVVETPAGSGNWQFPSTLTADGTYTIRARVYDQAGLASPIDVVTIQIAAVAAPKFYIEGSQTQSANAVTVSWTHNDNTNLQANGLMRSGSSNHNYVGVRISNEATGGAGDCKYRHFLIPACLFTGTSVWKLITTGAAKVVSNIAPGTQKDSTGNFDYHEGQSTFPDMSDPAWGPIAVGSLLHTCTAVVLHSPDDPLMVPDGSGGMMAIQDIWFDTVDPSPTPPWAAGSFQAEILERIDSYNGSTGGFWSAVTSNVKIANRNINIQNTGT